jgi:rubrerythrin
VEACDPIACAMRTMYMNFDIDRYLVGVAPLDDSDIDYSSFVDQPLSPEVLRCLRYMHDVEHHTTCYLRDLLVTSAHDDPEITSFLAMWAFEEFWHGEAIGKVLHEHGECHGRTRVAATRRRVGRDRLKTLFTMAASSVTSHFEAVALTWGAVNEWTTQAGYVRLASKSEHPVLAELLRRIAKQEGKHIDFYASQAERRLQAPAAQRLVRLALRRSWKPVGSGVMPRDETSHLVTYLFGDQAGSDMADRVDRRISRLPGLGDLRLVADARTAYAA